MKGQLVIQIVDIDHVVIEVKDVDSASDSWQVEFSMLERRREGDSAYLACNYEDYSVVLQQTDTPGLARAAYQLHPDHSLDDAATHLRTAGVDFDRDDESVFFADPEGNGVSFVSYRPRTGQNELPIASRRSPDVKAGSMRRLGHVNYLVQDINRMVEFYTEIVGQRLADRLGADAGAFMRIGADHHVNAFVNTGSPHPHHLAFDVGEWGQIRDKFDHLSQHGRWFPWGPVRHGVGGNTAGYVRIPEAECFVELYCDMEQLDEFHEPREFPDDRHSSSVWGMLPPRSYFRFDEETVAAERESLREIWR